MSQGEIRKRVWFYKGRRREAWGYTVVIDGKRVRRQGFSSRAEAQDALDELKRPGTRASAPPSTITLGEAFQRYFQQKSRKRSLKEDERIAKHLKAEFGAKTPLNEITPEPGQRLQGQATCD